MSGLTPEHLAHLRAELDAERISYGEMMDIDAAFEQLDPALLRDLPENAMASDKLDELEDATWVPRGTCAICSEPIESHGSRFRHAHADRDTTCGTGDGSVATPRKTCHCGAPAQGPPSQYPDVCTQWPLCEQKENAR